jgi:hypothetical protein
MRRTLICTCALALLATDGRTETREISTMKEILPSLGRDVLLVLDIDNTLIEPTGNLGSDQWYYYLVKRRVASGLARAEAERRTLALWNDVQWLIRVRPVEKETPSIIAQAQRRGTRILALTARTPDLALRTRLQLASVGIRLAGLGPDLSLSADGAIRFIGGGLYVGDNRDKGEQLLLLLRRLRLAPKKIVFVDDKAYNVRHVERAVGRLRIPFQGFRYAATDERVRAFESDVADSRLFLAGELGPQVRAAIDRAKREAIRR